MPGRLVKTRAGYSEDTHVSDCLVWGQSEPQSSNRIFKNPSGRHYIKKADIGKPLDRGFSFQDTSEHHTEERNRAIDALRGWPGTSREPTPKPSTDSPERRQTSQESASRVSKSRGSTARRQTSQESGNQIELIERSSNDTVMDALNGWPNTQGREESMVDNNHFEDTRGFSDEIKEAYSYSYPWIHPTMES